MQSCVISSEKPTRQIWPCNYAYLKTANKVRVAPQTAKSAQSSALCAARRAAQSTALRRHSQHFAKRHLLGEFFCLLATFRGGRARGKEKGVERWWRSSPYHMMSSSWQRGPILPSMGKASALLSDFCLDEVGTKSYLTFPKTNGIELVALTLRLPVIPEFAELTRVAL